MIDDRPAWPRIVSEHNTGDHPPGLLCPRCGGRILYAGNYFCEFWGCSLPGDDGTVTRHGGPCNWAMPHPVRGAVDRAICDRLGIGYE